MPRPCHALTMPFFSRPRHSTATERGPVGYLPTFGFLWLPHGVPRRLLSEAYQSSSQWSIPTTVNRGSSTLQKRRSVKLLDQQFGYFRLPRGLSRRTRHCQSRAGARHGVCELTARYGRGTAWAWHGHGIAYRRFKTANSRWSGSNSCGDAARGHEQFQVPTRGMRALKRKPSWGRYFQNINFQTGIKQNGYSYAFYLWPINR